MFIIAELLAIAVYPQALPMGPNLLVKIRMALLLLLALTLPGQLLAAASMSGCAAGADMMAGAMPMMGHAGHLDAQHHAVTPGDDCCHGGHAGGCPMASCINAMVSGFAIFHLPRSGITPSPRVTLDRYEQHTATRFRPPIFA